jgi:hypothetical protein
MTSKSFDKVNLVSGRLMTRKSNLVDLFSEFSSAATTVARGNLSRVTNASEPGFFIFSNGPTALLRGGGAATLLYRDMTVSEREGSFQAQTYLFCASGVLAVIVVFFLFRPAISQVEATRRGVFQMFADIPMKNVTEIQVLSAERAGETNEDAAAALAAANAANQEGANVEDQQRTPLLPADDGRQAQRTRVRTRRSRLNVTNSKTTRIFVQVSLLLFLSFSFFFGSWWMARGTFGQRRDSVETITDLGAAHALAVSIVTDATRLSTASITGAQYGAANASELAQLIQDNTQRMMTIVSDVLYGVHGRYRGLLGLHEELDEFMLQDACSRLASASARCSTFHGGVMTHGFLSALFEYVRAVDTASQLALGTSSAPDALAARGVLLGSEFELPQTLLHEFVSPGFDQALRLISEYESVSFAALKSNTVVLLVVFLVALFFLWLIVYDPLIRRLDREVKRTRGMVIMIPLELIEKLPPLRSALLAIKM